ncbi:MAG: XdhC family protein [Kiritimatiellae bacterium]|jgi:xanthine dehydrogenase accessory factor|nr:XdhC family protein [Kiritimatiellia bacterium]MDY0150248.1 XdhC family protein [Kiritimatiellia bacterium]
MKDVQQIVGRWDAAGLASAEAVLVGVQHSSPRQPGARLVVNEKGEAAGAVSMGCVESDLREHLLGLLRGESAPRIVHYGASFGPSLEVGLTCGGEIDVWIRRHDPDSSAWKRLCALTPDDRAILLTRLAGDSDQILLQSGDSPPADEMVAALDDLWKRGGTRKLTVHDGDWFAELIAPQPRLMIVGASPIAAGLCDLASRVGFRVWVIDPRRDFAREELFPTAEAVVHRWPEEGLAEAGLDEHAYVAVVAHDAKLDVPALSAALRARARYIGLLGSPGTQADRRQALEEAGFAPEEVARIEGPIGLKAIGALEPAEIAVSILAELIMVRRGVSPAKWKRSTV